MKKKHFYHQRIKILTMTICFVVIGLLTASIVSANDSQSKEKEKLSLVQKFTGGAVAASMAFVPFALVKDLKAKGKWDSLDDATKTYVEALEENINNSFKSIQGGLTEEQVKAKHDEWMQKHGKGLTEEQMKQFTDSMETIRKQAEILDKMKDNGLENSAAKSLIKQLRENDAKVKAFKQAGRGSASKLTFEIQSKAVATQAATDIATHTIGMRVAGIGQIPVRKPFMRDLFNVVNCTLEYIKYIDQETVVRDAKNVASGATSTHTTKLTWKERSIQITNIRDMINVPIDMLDDYDFVEGELNRLLDTNVQLKIDNGLLNGTGVHPELHSVLEVASEFDATNTLTGTITPWNGTVKSPNIFDLVIAMASHIVSLGQDGAFMPNVVLFNTIDRYKSLLIKDADDNYLMPPFVVRVGGKEYNIDGMIVRSNPNVAANSVVVFDNTKGTIYQRKNAIAEISYENASNFETETATLKVYERLNLLIRNVDANAFMKCTDVETALAALQAP